MSTVRLTAISTSVLLALATAAFVRRGRARAEQPDAVGDDDDLTERRRLDEHGRRERFHDTHERHRVPVRAGERHLGRVPDEC